jgi:hypothetical protein
MTTRVILECDAFSCSREIEIEDTYDSDVTRVGWYTAPDNGFTHYCPACWEKVKYEYDDEDDD